MVSVVTDVVDRKSGREDDEASIKNGVRSGHGGGINETEVVV